MSTVGCLKATGVEMEFEQSRLLVKGRGEEGLREPSDVLDAGNSATTMRMLLALLSSYPIFSVITGDESLRKRPMRRVVEPLQLMGADISGRSGANLAPLAVMGGELQGINFSPDVASAQVKSTVLLAGLRASGSTTVVEKLPTRDHTERMLERMGGKIKKKENRISVEASTLESVDFKIPGDFSSAAYVIALGVLASESEIVVIDCGLNPTRLGLLRILENMGGDIELEVESEDWEPVGQLGVRSSELRGVEVDPALVVEAIDEIPLVALLASQAEGRTVIKGAGELRRKESDRLKLTCEGLNTMGARITETEDGLIIEGPTPLRGAVVDSGGDHRIGLTLAVAGSIAEGTTKVTGWEWTDVSYPGFRDALDSLIK